MMRNYILLFLIIYTSASAIAQIQWKEAGRLPVGYIRNFFISKTGTLFASGEQSLFQSKNKGDSWERVDLPVPFSINCFDEFGENLLIGTENHGIYSYQQSSGEWTSITGDLITDKEEGESLSVNTIITIEDLILANVYHNGSPAHGGSHSRIYSYRGGKWERETQFNLHNRVFSFSKSGGRVIAATLNGIFIAQVSSRPLEWEEKKDIDGNTIVARKIVSAGGDVLIGIPDYDYYYNKNLGLGFYDPYYDKLFRSDDNGNTWYIDYLYDDKVTYGITDLFWSNSELYASTYYYGLVKTSLQNIQYSWEEVYNSSSSYTSNINISEIGNKYLTTENGVKRLLISDSDWIEINNGLEINYVHYTYCSSKYLFAVTENGLYRKVLNTIGIDPNWELLELDDFERFSEIRKGFISIGGKTSSSKNEFYFATNYGIFLTKDEGESFQQISYLPYKYDEVWNSWISYQDNIQNLISVGNDLYAIAYETPFILKDKEGEWEPLINGLPEDNNNNVIKGIKEVSGDMYILFENYSIGQEDNHDIWTIPDKSYIYKYNKLLNEWKEVKRFDQKAKISGFESFNNKLIFSARTATGKSNLYNLNLSNINEDFQTLKSPLEDSEDKIKEIYAINGKLFLTATNSSKIHISSDGGSNWTSFTNENSITNISFDNHVIYTGTSGDGVLFTNFYEFFPPVVSTNPASDVKASMASVSGTVTTENNYSANVKFQYNKDSIFAANADSLVISVPITGKNVAVAATLKGLKGNQKYFYRIKAQIGNSMPVFSKTKSFITQPFIDSISTELPNIVTADPINKNTITEQNSPLFSLKLNHVQPGTIVTLHSKSITRTNIKKDTLQSSTSSFASKLPHNLFDEIGLEYYLTVKIPDGYYDTTRSNVITTKKVLVAINHPQGLTMDSLKLDFEKKYYQNLSFPLVLDNNTVQAVLGDEIDLSTPDPAKWRLLHYKTPTPNNKDLWYNLVGSLPLEIGKGYWLAASEGKNSKKTPINITISSGNTVAHQLKDTLNGLYYYPIILSPDDWNQVGNPFLLHLNWGQILRFNGFTENDISKRPITYTDGVKDEGITRSREGIIPKFNGFYVKNFRNQPLILKVPVKRNENHNGERRNEEEAIEEASKLLVQFKVTSNYKTCKLGGLGINSSAQIGLDNLDLIVPPSPSGYPTILFNNIDTEDKIVSSIVPPTGDGNTWDFTIKEIEDNTKATISWPQIKIEEGMQLWLHDLSNESIIDMLITSSYSFSANNRFKVYYGSMEYITENLLPAEYSLKVFPNPIEEKFTVSFALPKTGSNYKVKISLVDLTGKRLETFVEKEFPEGFYTETIKSNLSNKSFSSGVKLIELLVIEKSGLTKQVYSKVIFQ